MSTRMACDAGALDSATDSPEQVGHLIVRAIAATRSWAVGAERLPNTATDSAPTTTTSSSTHGSQRRTGEPLANADGGAAGAVGGGGVGHRLRPLRRRPCRRRSR